MRAVLGIDAAWTLTQPSGVAAAVETPDGWRLAALAGSYRDFEALADPHEPHQRPAVSPPDAARLLSAAAKLCRRRIDLVAIDMPLAHSPITGRRRADNAVTSAYGARHCGTHSPSALRPGRISDDLRAGFAAQGYPLRATEIATPGLIEVYPHPALVELTNAARRLPYKVSRARKYWPELQVVGRREQLVGTWRIIIEHLERHIVGVDEMLPVPGNDVSTKEMKSFEDKLDAVVCAWVAICCLNGRASPYGDASASIWIPGLL